MNHFTLKDYCKKWSVQNIMAHITSLGMSFQEDMITLKELNKDKKILAEELESRINNN